MPPNQPPSTFPEPPDPLELLDGAVLDLMGEAVLPPMSGGALPGYLDDAWDWTKKNLLDPGGAFLRDVLAELGRTVSGAVTTIASWLLKWVYHLVRYSLWYAIPSGHRLRYPSVYNETTQSPYQYLSRIFRILGSVIEGIVGPLISWLAGVVQSWTEYLRKKILSNVQWVAGVVQSWTEYLRKKILSGGEWVAGQAWNGVRWAWNQVSAGLGWVAGAAWDGARWIWGQVSAGLGWVAGQAWDGARWIWGQVSAGLGWVAGQAWDGARWIWAQVEAGLQWAWDNVISMIPEGIVKGAAVIGELIEDAFKWLVETAFYPVAEILKRKLAIPGKMVRGGYETMGEWVDDLLDPPPLTNFLQFTAWISVGFFSILLALSPALAPITFKWAQQTHEIVRDRLLEPRTVIEAMWRDYPVSHGYERHLARLGYTNEDIITMLDLGRLIPGPSDLTTMGVREVFTPEIAERFGQFEDFPPAFGEWMGKQGYSMEWARNYWAMHWGLPSVTQGFEMFHRDVIAEADLQLLLRALDVMPYWRDKLTEIAYRVITRVDVRRMYAEGVFNRDQVLRVYRDLGYKPEDAEALTEFVVLRYPPKGAETADDLRSVTVSTIKQAYARRLITHDDALENLQELDYSPDDAQLIISIWEFDWTQDPSLRSDVDPKGLARSVIEKAYERRLIDLNAGVRELGELGHIPEDARLLLQLVDLRLEEQLADLEIDGLVSDYQDGVITDGQFAAALADLHVPEARVDFLLRREILSRQAKRRRLTLSQMKKAVADDLMDVGEYRARLDVMGYNSRDVDILVALDVEAV